MVIVLEGFFNIYFLFHFFESTFNGGKTLQPLSSHQGHNESLLSTAQKSIHKQKRAAFSNYVEVELHLSLIFPKN